MKINLNFILIFILTVFISCQKQKLKQPVKTHIQFSLIKNTTSTNFVKINYGNLIIKQFNFNGERVEGVPFNFDRYYKNGLNITFNNEPVNELTFDIPQGDYTKLNFNVYTLDGVKGLQIHGNYKLSQGPNVNVILEIEDELVFELITIIPEAIEFKKKSPKFITLNYNTDFWFEALTKNDLDNATLTTNNNGVGLGNSTIFINQTQNTNLYQKIISRVLMENNVTVK